MKKLVFLITVLFSFNLIFAADLQLPLPEDFSDPCEGYWISYHLTKKYAQGGWHVYVDKETGLLHGDSISLADTEKEKANAAAFKKREIPDYPKPHPENWAEVPTIGNPWMINLKYKEKGSWEDGKILDPSNGSIYQCRCFFHPADGDKYETDTLEVRGEIFKGVGVSIYWKRVTEEEALSIQKK